MYCSVLKCLISDMSLDKSEGNISFCFLCRWRLFDATPWAAKLYYCTSVWCVLIFSRTAWNLIIVKMFLIVLTSIFVLMLSHIKAPEFLLCSLLQHAYLLCPLTFAASCQSNTEARVLLWPAEKKRVFLMFAQRPFSFLSLTKSF